MEINITQATTHNFSLGMGVVDRWSCVYV